MNIPSEARAVVIGGGVSGCSLAYHLAKLGWKDVILLERKKLTSGTTWHAAGLIGQLRANLNMTRLAKYSADLYTKLEAETGVATGMRQSGSLTVALTDSRKQEILRQASMARAFGVEVNEITNKELKEKYPLLNVEDVKAAVHLPKDGQCDPANIAMALAKGARQNGVKIFEDVKVTGLDTHNGRVSSVHWESNGETGMISTEIVANCAGMWARELGNSVGVTVPLHACEHFYILTEPISDLGKLPVLRVPDEYAYYKEDAGRIMLGAFEPNAKPWGMKGIPEDFCFDELPEDLDHFEPVLEKAISRLPVMSEYGIQTFFNGPESFTPDDRYYLGEAPELKGFWVAAGYNSIGIISSGGAGMALAQWMNDGDPPFDLWDVDIRRAQPFQRNKFYLQERVKETLGLLYADHFPYRQVESARNIRRSPLHEHLKKRGAVFGEMAGWERANWFASEGQEARYIYDWGKQNWFENHRKEHLSVREKAGLFDMTSFGKIRVDGKDACKFLQHVCCSDVDVSSGRIIYTQMLNKKGGIECDLTVTRLSEESYLLVVPGATLQRDLSWLKRHKSNFLVSIIDFTAAEAVLVLMGPNSRKILQSISPEDFSNDTHPFGFSREIEIGYGLARAHRISYVGELGWELYVSSDMACHVFEEIEKAGKNYELKLCGLHTLDSCRIEKGFRHFGHDITDEDHILEAGLGFAVNLNKGDFIGKEAFLEKKDLGLDRRLLQFKLLDPDEMLFHNEPILRNGEVVSYLTSGNYGHYVGGAIGLGYVPCKGEKIVDIIESKYEIDIAGKTVEAIASLKPMYDPKADRVKG